MRLSSLIAAVMSLMLGRAALAQAGSPPAPTAQQAWGEIESSEPGLHVGDGWTFSVGVATPVGAGDLAASAARERASFESIVALARSCFDAASVDPPLGEGPAARLAEEAIFIARDKVSVAGLETVQVRQLVDGRFEAVHAIPSARLAAQRVVASDVLESLRLRHRSAPLPWPLAMLWVELADGDRDRAAALDALAAALGSEFGVGVSQSLRGERLECLPAAWNAIPRRLDGATRGALGLEQALRALGRRAHDSDLADRISEELSKAGWSRCAGAMQRLPRRVEYGAAVAPTPLQQRTAPVELTTPAAQIVLLTDGAFPFAPTPNAAIPDDRTRGFVIRQPAEAIPPLLAAMGTCPSAETLSEIAMALRGVGMHAESAAFSRAAFLLKPNHPFAGVDLLIALRATDRAAEAREVLAQVRAEASLDAWGRRQLDEIERWVAEAVPR